MANTNNRRESHTRSIVKTMSWRILATITTTILVYIFTKDFTIAIEVGGLEAVAKLLFYYFHERVWSTVRWGVAE